MPEVYNNIYVETGVGSIDDLTYLNVSEFTIGDSDKIGGYQLPTIYNVPQNILDGLKVLETCFNTEFITNSGIDDIITHLNLDTTNSGIYSKVIDFFRGDVYTSLDDFFVEYNSGSDKAFGLDMIDSEYTAGENFDFYIDFWVAFWISIYNYLGTHDITAVYSIYTAISGINDLPVDFNNDTTFSGSLSKVVDLSFAGWILNKINGDILNTELQLNELLTESEVITGGLLKCNLDFHNTLLSKLNLYSNVLCCLVDYYDVDFETTVISGSVDKLDLDFTCAFSGTNYFDSDVDLFPIKIYNFSVEAGNYIVNNYLSVDIEDDLYGITTSGTTFLINDVEIPVTFSGINDGYRMFYYLDDNFYDEEGPIVLTAHAENNNGDILEVDYYLTFGYIVEYKNREPWYDLDKKVVVRITAENYASCNKESTYAYWFETQDYKRNDLSAMINVIRNSETNITASIYPQSLAYFYGRTFTIELTAKDFSGNEMIPLEYSFTIEDKP